MLNNYVLLDLETTGATPLTDRITEIALIRFENGQEICRWQTLVNPGMPIPPFIQNLTGISNEMVKSAPAFEEVADTLLSYLEGAVLVAHNVRFDYGFLKNEFKRIGVVHRQKVLCTVKLSRKLYPEHRSHGLDALIARHQLTCEARHRAMGDVEMMVGFIAAAKLELGEESVKAAAEFQLKGGSLPPGLEASHLEDMPEGPGVYLFYGENQLPLYIGKSVNIRGRVLSHFSRDHASAKEMRISQEIRHVEWRETAGEFSALLLEARLVKERLPLHNRQLRSERQLCTWRIAENPNSIPLVELVRGEDITPANMHQLFGTFKTKRQAVEVLRQMADNHQLCPKLLGLEPGNGPCFSFQLKRCKGVCAGKEAPEIHHLRLQQAMAAHKLKTWPYNGKIGIREHDVQNDLTEIQVFEHWCHLGTVKSEAELDELLESPSSLAFDLDTYKLLLRVLNQPKTEIIQFL